MEKGLLWTSWKFLRLTITVLIVCFDLSLNRSLFFLVNISNGEFLNDNNASNMINNLPMENHENFPQNNINLNPPNNDNNLFDEAFFKEWLFDLVMTINIWHIFLITAIFCYVYDISILYLILILVVYDIYDLFFLLKRMTNKKL